MEVPEILLSGHHENIKTWRQKEAFRRTWQRRPDLLAELKLAPKDSKILEQIAKEEQGK
jgi:tRNA (guanine37-N1)-methyltransferase